MLTFDQLLGKEGKTVAEILLVQAIATLSTTPTFASMTPHEVFDTVVSYAFPIPDTLFFWDNGMVLAGDVRGKQMPRYNGKHRQVLDQLAADGIPLEQVKNVYGSPDNPVKWRRPGVGDEIPEQYSIEKVPWVTIDPATELAVAKARLRGVCRICEQPISGAGSPQGWEHEFGERIFPDAVTLNFGDEFAHTACLPPKPDRTINESIPEQEGGG